MRRPGRLLATMVAALAMLGGARGVCAQGTGAADVLPPEMRAEVEQGRQQLRQLQREQELMQRRLDRFERSEQELLREIRNLTEAVRRSEQRTRDLQARLARLEAEQVEQEAEVDHLQEQVTEGKARIARRLRRLYRLHKGSRSQTVFHLAHARSFYKDAHLLQLLREADREAVRAFQDQIRELQEAQAERARLLQDLHGLEEALAAEREQLQQRQLYLRTALDDMRENQELYRRYLADIEESMDAMQSAVARMEAEPVRRRITPRDPAELKGALPPPAPGTLVAGFGQQDPRYELKKFQRGLVLRVQPETQARAVAAGKVVHAGRFRGYQDLVVVDHGKGLFTVYGHLEELAVRQGDVVEAQQVLGRATFQPVDEAHNLYFELRLDGDPQDPLAWLRPGSYGQG